MFYDENQNEYHFAMDLDHFMVFITVQRINPIHPAFFSLTDTIFYKIEMPHKFRLSWKVQIHIFQSDRNSDFIIKNATRVMKIERHSGKNRLPTHILDCHNSV